MNETKGCTISAHVTSAFVSHDDKTLTVVVINDSPAAQAVRLTGDRTVAAWTPHVTSSTDALAAKSAIAANAPFNLPPRSVVTLTDLLGR